MPPMAPEPETGVQFCNPVKSLRDMTPEEIFGKVRDKTVRAGEKAKEFGGKTINSIQEKLSNVEIKEGAKHVGEQISTKAKGIWEVFSTKVGELREKKEESDVKIEEKKEG